jgi:hypothetical protein
MDRRECIASVSVSAFDAGGCANLLLFALEDADLAHCLEHVLARAGSLDVEACMVVGVSVQTFAC